METNATELLRSNLQLQEQLHRVQLSIEENRQQADAAAASSAQSIANRLQLLEKTLAAERERDIDAVRSSTRVMWIVAGTFAGVGVIAMLLMAYQWRTVSHLAEVGLPVGPLYAAGQQAHSSFSSQDRPLLSNGSVDQSNAQLLSALGLLEKRIKELEHTGASTGKTAVDSRPLSDSFQLPQVAESGSGVGQAHQNRINVLIGKGQSLLNLDKAEEALTCFNEALEMDPGHPDALLKKAAVLERLKNLDEAIECYDRAIAADSSLTIAYLHKGGLFNRMERYSEALECYERALKAQEKR